jgi:hypothetical protein
MNMMRLSNNVILEGAKRLKNPFTVSPFRMNPFTVFTLKSHLYL